MAIVQLCYEARAWKTLNDQIHILSQRQPQLQQVTNVCEGSFLSSSVIIYGASHDSACCLWIICFARYFLPQAKESSIQKKNHIACRRKWKSEGIGDFENHIFCMWLLLFPLITIDGIRACKQQHKYFTAAALLLNTEGVTKWSYGGVHTHDSIQRVCLKNGYWWFAGSKSHGSASCPIHRWCTRHGHSKWADWDSQ